METAGKTVFYRFFCVGSPSFCWSLLLRWAYYGGENWPGVTNWRAIPGRLVTLWGQILPGTWGRFAASRRRIWGRGPGKTKEGGARVVCAFFRGLAVGFPATPGKKRPTIEHEESAPGKVHQRQELTPAKSAAKQLRVFFSFSTISFFFSCGKN